MQRVLFDSLGKVRRSLGDDLFRVRPVIYWLDFTSSIVIAWISFCLTLPRFSPTLLAQIAWFSISVLAFYRGLFFIHEIIHIRREKLRAFRWIWNAMCGITFFLPDFTYIIHLAHHSTATFSTNDDPEYVPMAYQKPLQLLAPFLIFPFVPLVMMLRFLVAGPLSWIIGGKFREWLLRSASSLKMNPNFEWKNITDDDRRLALTQEIGCAIWWSGFLGLAFSTGEPGVVTHWYLVYYLILTVNHIRSLVAHRYINESGGKVSYEDQLLDSITITSSSPLAVLLAPVGLRYHSLHHLFPTLPYHAYGEAHRRLVKVLPADHIYMKTLVPGVTPAFRAFLASVTTPRAASVRVASAQQ
ncbi:MAG TPA: fatty acid desaturase [Bryobacteraceae bacterium]